MKIHQALLSIGSHMNAGLRLQAQWELEVSTPIFRRRKKVLFLACLPLFIPIVFNLALASDIQFLDSESNPEIIWNPESLSLRGV